MSTPDTSRNIEGDVTAITVFSALRWWGRLWLPILFAAIRRFPALTTTLQDLSFIHFARWTIVRRLPYNGHPQPLAPLRYPHLYFESNFNADPSVGEHDESPWEEYIDAFSTKLTRGMRVFWGSSYGFPGAVPVGPFKRYIREHEYPVAHLYDAYPEASTTEIRRALKLDGYVPTPSRSRDTNVTGQAYALTVMTPILLGQEDALEAYLQAMDPSPLASLPRTHLGRFVVVRDFAQDSAQPAEEHLPVPYLIFTSNFDGDLDSYLDELCALPDIYAVWWRCIGCPKPAEGDLLKAYLKHNQIHTGVFFAAYGDATVARVHEALEHYPPSAPDWVSTQRRVRLHVARATDIVMSTYRREHVPGALARRDQHPIEEIEQPEHGTLHGTLRTLDGLPATHRVGLFAEPREYGVLTRFSPNGTAPRGFHPPRGVAVKVLDVPGPDGEMLEQDFLFGNAPVFFCRSAEDAVDLMRARNIGGARGLAGFFFPSLSPQRWRLRELRIMLALMRHRVSSPLAIPYFTGITIGWGDTVAKLSLHPQTGGSLEAGVTFALAAHVQTDPVTQPADDPTVEWPDGASPPTVVAELHFPAQQPINGEGLQFTLDHALPAHVVRNGLGQVRIGVYAAVFGERTRLNALGGGDAQSPTA